MSRILPGSTRETRYVIGALALCFAVVITDQLSKIWVETSFGLGESLSIIPGYLSFTSVRNHGAAWSLLSGYSWLLLIIGVVVALGCVIFFRYLAEGCAERYLALGSVLGGILGNSLDRLWRGVVVDFIDVHYYAVWQYPVFNIADIAICCGVGVYLLSNLLRKSADSPQTDTKKAK